MGSLLRHVGSFTAGSFAVARRLSSRGVTSVAPQHVGSELTRDQSSIAYISRWAQDHQEISDHNFFFN